MADSNVEVKLKNVRLSFFHGFDPQERRNDAKVLTGMNYNTAILLDKVKDADQIDKIKAAMKEARTARWGDNPPRMQPDKYCLRDGEPADEDGNPSALYEGYEGCMYLSANRSVSLDDFDAIKAGNKKPPVSIIGPRRGPEGKFVPLKESSEFAPYSGCFANVIVRIYGYASEDNPSRINASLEAVQFFAHGERFGYGGIDVEDAFDEVEGHDDMDETPADKPAESASGDPMDMLG